MAEPLETLDLAFPAALDLAGLAAAISVDVPGDPSLVLEPLEASAILAAEVPPGDAAPVDERAFEPVASEPIASEPMAFEPVAFEPMAFEPMAFEPIAFEEDVAEVLSLLLALAPANAVTADPVPDDGVIELEGEPAIEPESGFAIDDSRMTSAPADAAPPGEGVTTSAEPAPGTPPAADAHSAFVRALVEVALCAGATRAAALLPSLLDGSGVHAVAPDLCDALVAARVLERHGDEMRPAEAFTTTAVAWRRVLREETSDLSACGASTLDTWGAELLAALGVGRDPKLDVRREVRKRGVAAFGMRLVA